MTINLQKQLSDAIFAIVDVETTGLHLWEQASDPSISIEYDSAGVIQYVAGQAGPGAWNRIVEVGAVLVNCRGEQLGHFTSFVDPERSIGAEAEAVHGIRDADVRGAPKASEVLRLLFDFLRPSDMVFGFNSPFDLRFIMHEALLVRGPPVNVAFYDVARFASYAGFGRQSLTNLALALGLHVDVTHRALADTQLTAQVLAKLLEMRFKPEAPLGELVALHDSRTPVYDSGRCLPSVQASHEKAMQRKARRELWTEVKTRNTVCITGAIPGIIRREVRPRLEALGYRYVEEVSTTVEFVVIGHR